MMLSWIFLLFQKYENKASEFPWCDYHSLKSLTLTLFSVAGYSRIPIYDGSHNNIVSVLFVKDLMFMDPDDNKPLKTLCNFYKNPLFFVYEDTTLDVMFNEFKEGEMSNDFSLLL